MSTAKTETPDSTAIRVALWRALHVQIDAPPHVLNDEVGLQLAAPEENWRERGDMNPQFTKPFRASIVARARFIEDLLAEQSEQVTQYVILGAGLDTFAIRKPEIASKLKVFEVDQPATQAWKRKRLLETGLGIPEWLRFVPVDFEANQNWCHELEKAGFNSHQPTIVTSIGVSMYLTQEAIEAMLRQTAKLAPGSTFIMTFLLPLRFADQEVRPALEMAEKGAKASGTPFLSFFTPEKVIALAHKAGFKKAEHISASTLAEKYFAGRADGLRPPSNAEELLIAIS